jgi:aryl-alcohol dehydrogenase-like predicted oxidoreductase
MQMRSVGGSSLKVSILGLGCNNFGGRMAKDRSLTVVRKALDLGINHFDTADVYPMGAFGVSEEILGEALGGDRAKVVIATKVGHPATEDPAVGGSRRYVTAAVEASLKRLKTDRIDLCYFHKPDPNTPIEETIRAFDELIRAGKVRFVGCSNFAAWQTVQAVMLAREIGANAFICAQEQYSLLARDAEREVIPALNALGLGFVPYFPLASGLLTGKYTRGAPAPEGSRLAKAKSLANMFLTDRNLERVDRYRNFASARGRSLLDLAISWLLARKPVSSVITGATSPEQLEANAKAVGWELSSQDLAEIDRVEQA